MIVDVEIIRAHHYPQINAFSMSVLCLRFSQEDGRRNPWFLFGVQVNLDGNWFLIGAFGLFVTIKKAVKNDVCDKCS